MHSSVNAASIKVNQGGDWIQIEVYNTSNQRFVLYADANGFGVFNQATSTSKRVSWN